MCIPASSTRRSCLKSARASTGVALRSIGRSPDSGPQIGLQLVSSIIDLPQLILIAGFIEQYTLVEILNQQGTHSRRIGGGQQVCPDIFRANRVGLCLLVVLALIVPVWWPWKS